MIPKSIFFKSNSNSFSHVLELILINATFFRYLDILNTETKSLGLVRGRFKKATAEWKLNFINCETNEVEPVLDDSGFVEGEQTDV